MLLPDKHGGTVLLIATRFWYIWHQIYTCHRQVTQTQGEFDHNSYMVWSNFCHFQKNSRLVGQFMLDPTNLIWIVSTTEYLPKQYTLPIDSPKLTFPSPQTPVSSVARTSTFHRKVGGPQWPSDLIVVEGPIMTSPPIVSRELATMFTQKTKLDTCFWNCDCNPHFKHLVVAISEVEFETFWWRSSPIR